MASHSSKKEAAPRGTTDIESWFNGFDGFAYDDGEHVLDNFAALIKHLQAKPEYSESKKPLNRLVNVIRRSNQPFPPSSGIAIYAQDVCNKYFLGAWFNPDQAVPENIALFCTGPKWDEWCKDFKNQDGLKKMRKAIGKKIKSDWRSTWKTRHQKAQVVKKNGKLASARSSVASSSKKVAQATNKIGKPAGGHSSVAPMSTKKSQEMSLAEVEKLLSKAAPAFFAKYKEFRYRQSESVEINFLRFVEFKSLKDVHRVDGYLRTLIEQAVSVMQPAAIDQVWEEDYAKRFFAGYKFFQRTPGSNFRKELDRLMSHKLFKHPPTNEFSALERLKQSVAGNLAVNIKNSLKDSPRLSVLADPKKIIAQASAAIPKVPPVRTSQPSSPQTDDGIPVSLQRWLDQYPKFTPDPNESLITEFDRLALAQNWSHRSKTYKAQRAQFFTRKFEDEWSEIAYTPDDSDGEDGEGVSYGVSIDKAYKLSQWQDLCNELGIEPMPKTQTQCRKALEKINVNIVDLLEARRVNKTNGDGTVAVRRFETPGALGRYIRKNPEKIFSKGEAKRQGALRALLVHVFSSPCGQRALS